MPTPPPIPPDERSPFGPDGAPKTFADVSHRIRRSAERQERDPLPTGRPGLDPASPWLKLAGAALAGYALGLAIHGGSGRREPRPSPRPRPRTMPEPVATYRSSRPAEDRRSSVRFR